VTAAQHRQEIDPLLGQTIGERFTLLSVLGRGFSSTVYLAQDGDKKRALKLLAEQQQGKNSLHERFLREARLLQQIEHPNLVRVYESGYFEGRPYLVMEHLRGHSLAAEIAQGAIQPGRAVRIASLLLAALEEAHKHGIIHRDIKPANILLAQNGLVEEVKVLDFGIAKSTEQSSEEALTTDGVCYGTPHYMSPEQSQGADIDARSDLYSVGVVLYEMLCGKRPFVGKTPIEIASKHLRDKALPLSQQHAALQEHPALQDIVDKALAKTIGSRYKNATAFREALEALWKPTPKPLLWVSLLASLGLLGAALWQLSSQRREISVYSAQQTQESQESLPAQTRALLIPGKNLVLGFGDTP
jgi:serine/threonine protein kinase